MTEYLAENSRLRQLARRYAEGQLALEEYRAARREILEALEADQAQAVAAAPTPAELPSSPATETGAREPADDATLFFETTPSQATGDVAIAAAVEPAGWDSNTRILAAVLGIFLLLAISALVYVFAL